MKNLPTLPTGNSSFENIRRNGDIYVDKTRHICQMIRDGKYFFLSRPRRFGKSLMVSTLKCLFEGKENLFEGLWIKSKNKE
ncbi:AAA family ATPase, partial [Desulfamplus magnetovallimortis]|uniref:AAA family ATPase n=1 Tax=Desulfamplus magnetovallimortis TaxID=1246637 RepID=UPI00164402D9